MGGQPEVEDDDVEGVTVNEHVFTLDISVRDEDGLVQSVSDNVNELVEDHVGLVSVDPAVRTSVDEGI